MQEQLLPHVILEMLKVLHFSSLYNRNQVHETTPCDNASGNSDPPIGPTIQFLPARARIFSTTSVMNVDTESSCNTYDQ